MRLTVDGQSFDIDADPDMPLLWALRDLIGKTGPKFGCGIAAWISSDSQSTMPA